MTKKRVKPPTVDPAFLAQTVERAKKDYEAGAWAPAGDVTLFVATEEAVDAAFEGWTRPERAKTDLVRRPSPFGGAMIEGLRPVLPRAADCTATPRLPEGDAHTYRHSSLLLLAGLIADLTIDEIDLVHPRLSDPARLTPLDWPHALARLPRPIVETIATRANEQIDAAVALTSQRPGLDGQDVRARTDALVRLARISIERGAPLWAYAPREYARTAR